MLIATSWLGESASRAALGIRSTKQQREIEALEAEKRQQGHVVGHVGVAPAPLPPRRVPIPPRSPSRSPSSGPSTARTSHRQHQSPVKKASQFMARAARLSEAFSVVKRSPIIRPALPAGSITSWPVASLR